MNTNYNRRKERYRNIRLLATALFLFGSPLLHAQGIPSLFHRREFQQVGGQDYSQGRAWKTRVDAGLALGYYNFDPHYTNGVQSHTGFTFGVREEIPIMRTASLMVGLDYENQGASFNSYYFAKGYSFLYNPSDELYNHNLSIGSFDIPIEYRFPLTSEAQKRSLYGVLGVDYRLFIYTNTVVTNSVSGTFVYEGQNNLQSKYVLLSNQGCPMIELALGYQRNFPGHQNSFFVEINYRYGLSPVIYTGNNMGSNYIQFTMNTLDIRVGIKI